MESYSRFRTRSANRPFSARLSRWLLGIILLGIFVTLGDSAAAAQSYSFSVPDLRMQVFVQPDASARILYDITFANSPAGRPIDIVDIGVPHSDYSIANMRASMNGVDLPDIRVSEYVDPGIEVHLHDHVIPAGGQGTIQFEFTMPNMVYEDTTQDEYASMQITPTWFDSEFVSGSSDVWVLIHMLPGILPEEVLFQDEPFTEKAIFEDHTVAGWRWENGQATGPNNVGISFPQRGMTRVVTQSLLELINKFFVDNPAIRLALGALSVGLLAVAFFRFSGGTGFSVFAILAIGLMAMLVLFPASILLGLPVTIVLVVLNERYLSGRKRRYLPAIAQVEGGGIKRGLTAPEAAVLLELPLNKVLLLIVFGLLEKGVVRQVADSPLKVEVEPEFKVSQLSIKERRPHLNNTAQRLGIVLRKYEHAFLALMEMHQGQPVHKIDFAEPMKRLIQHMADRVKGFDLSDTQDYYRKIIARAMKEATGIGDIPERERYLDRHLQWLLLDDAYPTVFTSRGYHYRPVWVRPFASADRIGLPTSSAKLGTPSYGGRTSFSDVAASFSGWTENTMGDMASAIAPGALQVRGPKGVINLSGADRVTGDIFKALTTSSGGGGSGGGCACACAGCACACACAGGGR